MPFVLFLSEKKNKRHDGRGCLDDTQHAGAPVSPTRRVTQESREDPGRGSRDNYLATWTPHHSDGAWAARCAAGCAFARLESGEKRRRKNLPVGAAPFRQLTVVVFFFLSSSLCRVWRTCRPRPMYSPRSSEACPQTREIHLRRISRRPAVIFQVSTVLALHPPSRVSSLQRKKIKLRDETML